MTLIYGAKSAHKKCEPTLALFEKPDIKNLSGFLAP